MIVLIGLRDICRPVWWLFVLWMTWRVADSVIHAAARIVT